MSGESGAGKTEAAKLTMRYLTNTCVGRGGHAATIARRVTQVMLESNVVLEAMGNAKTHRNDNSSRFGKWVALYFSQSGQAVGGKLTTYLLESVRVTRLMAGERNYQWTPQESHRVWEVPEGGLSRRSDPMTRRSHGGHTAVTRRLHGRYAWPWLSHECLWWLHGCSDACDERAIVRSA